MSQANNQTTNPTCPLCAARALTCHGDCLDTLQKSGCHKDGTNCRNEPAFPATKGGPRTAQGKAVSARNATTHGLFSRDVVLPSLGEDPEGYRQMEAEWMAQLAPRNLLERLYVEKIAAASWRLRRLNRWQAQLFEDDTLTEDQRLDKLDKVLRHETNLHRQIDTAVKMLNKDVPQLYKGRARDRALLDTMQTELDCREDRENALEVEFEARERLKEMEEATASPALDLSRLDAAQNATANCQNEPAPLSSSSTPVSTSQPTLPVPALAGPEGGGVAHVCAGVGSSDCQNEPAPASPSPSASPRIGGRGAIPSDSPSLRGKGGEPQASRGRTDFGILLASQLRKG